MQVEYCSACVLGTSAHDELIAPPQKLQDSSIINHTLGWVQWNQGHQKNGKSFGWYKLDKVDCAGQCYVAAVY